MSNALADTGERDQNSPRSRHARVDILCTTGKSTSSLCFIGVPRGHSIYQSRKEWAGERGILFPENLNETVLCRQG